MKASSNSPSNLPGLLLRIAIPCAILAAGWFGFTRLAVNVKEPPKPEPDAPLLRTRVEEIQVGDYPVFAKTNAVVQSHNQVTLTSQVSGRVDRVSPSFEVGAFFKEGDVLVEIDPRDYETALSVAKSQLAAANSELKLAKLVEERKMRLVESNAVSQGEVDVASASREQAEANVALAETQFEQAELDLQRTKIKAPFDGRVQTKLVGVGQMAGANNPLGDVFAIDFVEVRLPISSQQRRFLELPEFPDDPPVAVEFRDGIRETNETVWRGKIVRTEGVLDENSRDLYAVARIDDPFARETDMPPLHIGQPLVASIEGKVLRNVIALPRAAVRQTDMVVLVNPDDLTLKPLRVQPQWSDAEHVVVSAKSIPEGMWLAMTPMDYAPEGTKIEVIPAADGSASIADSNPPDADKDATN